MRHANLKQPKKGHFMKKLLFAAAIVLPFCSTAHAADPLTNHCSDLWDLLDTATETGLSADEAAAISYAARMAHAAQLSISELMETCKIALAETAQPAADDGITQEALESYFRANPVDGSLAVAVKVRFTSPEPGVAYVATVHGYGSRNMQVCEELIAPYNDSPHMSTIHSNTYYCELLD